MVAWDTWWNWSSGRLWLLLPFHSRRDGTLSWIHSASKHFQKSCLQYSGAADEPDSEEQQIHCKESCSSVFQSLKGNTFIQNHPGHVGLLQRQLLFSCGGLPLASASWMEINILVQCFHWSPLLLVMVDSIQTLPDKALHLVVQPPGLNLEKKAFAYGFYMPQRDTWGYELLFLLKNCNYDAP